jgi:hypothetical protein
VTHVEREDLLGGDVLRRDVGTNELDRGGLCMKRDMRGSFEQGEMGFLK